jgi:NAD(P)H-hydrate epimerase
MDYGPVLVIAGAANYYWAPHASAYSFLKAGGGYVFLACPKSLAPSVAQGGKEVVFQPQKETSSGSIALENKGELLELSTGMKMVVLGPGLSLNEETRHLARELAREIEKPLLIDGDGITAVSQEIEILKERKAATILTPHLGEMARITRIEREEIESIRVDILQETARKLNATIVLKGPHSLIGCPDQRVFINVTGVTGGKAGMATAGSGDVLNGTIAAMFCSGLNIEEAVRTGVFIHGLSGDLVAEEKGADGMTAQDILDFLPYAVRYYRENLAIISENLYDTIFVV